MSRRKKQPKAAAAESPRRFRCPSPKALLRLPMRRRRRLRAARRCYGESVCSSASRICEACSSTLPKADRGSGSWRFTSRAAVGVAKRDGGMNGGRKFARRTSSIAGSEPLGSAPRSVPLDSLPIAVTSELQLKRPVKPHRPKASARASRPEGRRRVFPVAPKPGTEKREDAAHTAKAPGQSVNCGCK